MNWLFPGFLLGAAAILLPLILHFLRRRPTRPQPFPALRFFRGASPAEQRRHRLRRWLVLAMRCSVFALLAMMFARPFFNDRSSAPSRATIIVIDNSFSLQATGRWENLRSWARAEFGRFKSNETIGVLAMNPQPAWIVAPTRDIATAWRAFEQFQPGWQSTRAEPALRFAASTLETSSAAVKRIIFIGDHQALGWSNTNFVNPLPAGISVSFAPIPLRVASQAALEQPVVRREGETIIVQARVKNFTGAKPRTLTVFGDNATPVATARVDPASTDPVSVSFKSSSDVGQWVRCSLDPDDLPADDVAYALIPPLKPQSSQLLLVDRAPAGAEADYLGTAYEALAALPPAPRIAALSGSTWPAAAVVVLRNDASFAGDSGARLDAFLAQGGSALIFLTGGPAQTKWLAAHGSAPVPVASDVRIRDWSIEHPLVAPLAERGLRSLVGWTFSRGWSLPASAVEPIAFWADGSPALGEMPAGPGRVLIAGFGADRSDGDWPVEGAFVPFLHRAVIHLFKVRAPVVEIRHRVGQPITLPEEPGAWQKISDASQLPPQTVSGRVTVSSPGVYAWASASTDRRQLYAVGLDPQESDLAPWRDGAPWQRLVSTEKAPRKPARHVGAFMAQQAEQQGGLWWWCLLIAALFLLFELTLANRTSR